jgi:ubiquinone/menaquinone biosynthesis C-methylase UbiE
MVSLGKAFRVRKDDKMKALKYYESLSKDYNSAVEHGVLRYLRTRERRAVLAFADFVPGKSMIDVGCGGGFYALAAKKAGMRVCAVDASPGMVERLVGRVDETHVADIEALDLGKSFDRVICAGVLDFVTSPEAAFRNLSRLVAPGGRLVILVPSSSLGGLIYRAEKMFSGISVNLFSMRWFADMAREGGLSIVDSARPLPTNVVVHFDRPVTA